MSDVTSPDRAQYQLESRISNSLIDDQLNSHTIENSIVTDIKAEPFSELESNNCWNEYYEPTDIMDFKLEVDVNAELMRNDAQICFSDNVINEVNSVKREVLDVDDTQAMVDVYVKREIVDAGDTQAMLDVNVKREEVDVSDTQAMLDVNVKIEVLNVGNAQAIADMYVTSFQDSDNKFTVTVKDENIKLNGGEVLFDDKSISNLSEMGCQIEDTPSEVCHAAKQNLKSRNYRLDKKRKALLGCKEAIVVLEDFRLSKNNTRARHKQRTAGDQCPKTAEKKTKKEDKKYTLEREGSLKPIGAIRESIETERISESDKVSANSTGFNKVLGPTKAIENLIICDILDNSFNIKQKQKHKGFYHCMYCSYKSRNKSAVNQHTNNRHIRNTTHGCSHCSFKTFTKSCLIRHVNSQHTKTNSYSCSYCPYTAFTSVTLNRHINSVHTKSTTYSCSHCSYVAFRKSHLKVHVNCRHTKSTSYSCSQCSYTSYQRGHLRQHINSQHTKSTSYSCSCCSFVTYRKGDLNRHLINQHSSTNSNSYNCSQ